METYIQHALPGGKVDPISIGMLALLDFLTFNTGWKSMATLMRHYERLGEDGSPVEANRLLGAPAARLQSWYEAHKAG